ncbi:conserved exported protein of unknown function [Nitrospira sp. KM1]|uniref:hypothetical protein n=1 Tax=Nitrospira sp. KM1 TaxID=1936990 RepID=UPI0013A744E7|nr:hypothetical protein [Nitrospira sp. KM1]BCA56488.1 conserved exported protein of unknown function [Nitrospira sp. KM1]
MIQEVSLTLRAFLRDAAGTLYHVLVIILSAGIALLLPTGAKQFLALWSRVEHDKLSLIALEMTTAILLILCLNYIRRSLSDRALASAAAGAGLVSFSPRRARGAQQQIETLKEQQGTGRTIMVIGSSGYSTLVDQVGDLSSVLDKCLGAKILLVDPYSQEAAARIQAIDHPALTLTRFREEVRQSIALLKRLRAMGKAVKLKLYTDPPLIKMVILGDYLWLQHYHADLDIQTMPEYVLRHNRQNHNLYTLYAHYFEQRWESTDLPEYDLETDELVYRTKTGAEVRRERYEVDSHHTVLDGQLFDLPHQSTANQLLDAVQSRPVMSA